MKYKDYYKILAVQKGATDAEIKKSYRTLAKKYHPDRNQNNPKAENRFKDISEAYDVLSDKVSDDNTIYWVEIGNNFREATRLALRIVSRILSSKIYLEIVFRAFLRILLINLVVKKALLQDSQGNLKVIVLTK